MTHKLVNALVLEQLEAQDARIIFSYAEDSGNRYLNITCGEGGTEVTLTFAFNMGGDLLSKVIGKMAEIKKAEIADMAASTKSPRQ